LYQLRPQPPPPFFQAHPTLLRHTSMPLIFCSTAFIDPVSLTAPHIISFWFLTGHNVSAFPNNWTVFAVFFFSPPQKALFRYGPPIPRCPEIRPRCFIFDGTLNNGRSSFSLKLSPFPPPISPCLLFYAEIYMITLLKHLPNRYLPFPFLSEMCSLALVYFFPSLLLVVLSRSRILSRHILSSSVRPAATHASQLYFFLLPPGPQRDICESVQILREGHELRNLFPAPPPSDLGTIVCITCFLCTSDGLSLPSCNSFLVSPALRRTPLLDPCILSSALFQLMGLSLLSRRPL